MQLLPKISASPAELAVVGGESENVMDQAAQTKVVEDDEVQKLWEQAVIIDKEWQRARDSVQSGERGFPADIARKMKVNIAECSVAADGILRGRENRI